MSEAFNGRDGGIWTGEDAPSINDLPMFFYDGYDIDPDETTWIMGVHRDFNAILDAAGWYAEFYDPSTVMLYKA